MYGDAVTELHQLASPATAPDFLRRLLKASLVPSQATHEIGLFAEFGVRGWAGILKGRGLPSTHDFNGVAMNLCIDAEQEEFNRYLWAPSIRLALHLWILINKRRGFFFLSPAPGFTAHSLENHQPSTSFQRAAYNDRSMIFNQLNGCRGQP